MTLWPVYWTSRSLGCSAIQYASVNLQLIRRSIGLSTIIESMTRLDIGACGVWND